LPDAPLNLKAIISTTGNWPRFGARIGLRDQFERRFQHLNALRNAPVHPADLIVPGKIRQSGVAAVPRIQQVVNGERTSNTI